MTCVDFFIRHMKFVILLCAFKYILKFEFMQKETGQAKDFWITDKGGRVCMCMWGVGGICEEGVYLRKK